MTDSNTSFIGTADWHHADWRERFYPRHMPAHAWLDHYGRQLNTVELDAARLQPLDRNLAATWLSSVPENFRFTVQAPRLITHVHKLRNCAQLVTATLQHLSGLHDRMGPVLFSLPARWHCNLDRLERFLTDLPGEFRYAFEFHDPDWLRPATYALLREHGAALCVNDAMPGEHRDVVTSGFVYVRLYGPGAGGRYTSAGLRIWSTRIANWRRKRLDSYVLFHNDTRAYAAKNACLLRDYEGLRKIRGTR
ncbi:MAG: DUF72 domain-containing protein [Gammaproteobacteria bacterium]|nr:DUF72 domain-containing protein [Gammaproteobacteria bacterium]